MKYTLILGSVGITLLMSACDSNNYSNTESTQSQQIAEYTSTRYDQKAYPSDSNTVAFGDELNSTVVIDGYGELVAPLQDVVLNAEVLNQGTTNTCVTLSLLGSIGILTQAESTYFDPVCSLNLGNYLYYNDEYETIPKLLRAVNDDRVSVNYFPSGWKGSTLSLALAQLEVFGAVHTSGAGVCGTGSFYSDSNTQMINSEDFLSHADTNISSEVSVDIVCSSYDITVPDCDHSDDTVINQILSTIDNNGLALISFMVYEEDSSIKGLSGSHYLFDASGSGANVWHYNDDVQQCKSNNACTLAGHDIIVFGYIPHPSQPEKSLLVMRNSWGSSSGDMGNYYMTYEYVRNMILAMAKVTKK